MKSLTPEQFEEAKQLIRETALASSQAKDRELSGLHRELLNDMKTVKEGMNSLKNIVDSHDVTIKTIPDFFDRVQKFITRSEPAVKTFENLSWSGSTVVKAMVVVAAISGGIIGLKELIHNFIK